MAAKRKGRAKATEKKKKKKKKAAKGKATSLGDILDCLDPEFQLKREPKNIKTSVRNKFNRRCSRAAGMLEDLRQAAQAVLKQKGTIYKKKQVEAVLAGISKFEEVTGIKYEEPPPPTQEQLDHFLNALTMNRPWVPPPASKTVQRYVELGLTVPDDLRIAAEKEIQEVRARRG